MHPLNDPARAVRHFVVDKFRGECYETVKIQREVALNQFAIKGRSGSIEAVDEIQIQETDIEGNLNLSGVRQTTTQDKQLNKEQE
ncbi:hypothetical protein BY996DRAFT_6547198 [Phakopsora pachyrhizi]|nr:hypothetical protein BY996DRAFT_6547198 [Phakopsora pachyrhizi]